MPQEQITPSAAANRPLLASNPSGGLGGALAILHGIADELGNHVGGATPLKTAPQAGTPPIEATSSLSASGDIVAIAATGMNTAVVMLPVAPAGWSGTVVVEGTADGSYADATVLPVIPYGGGASVSALTAAGIYEVTVTGLKGVRLRATSAVTGGPIVALIRAAMGNKSIRVGAPANNPLPTLDANGAAFGTATAMTAGSAYTPGRSVGIIATAVGNITLTTSGGSTITLPIYVGWNTYPFAVTSFAWPSSGAGAGSVFNLS